MPREARRGGSSGAERSTYDTIGHNDQINLDLVQLVGADRVVLGSDSCFDMGLTDPVGTVERLAGLSQTDRNLILGLTAAQILRLG